MQELLSSLVFVSSYPKSLSELMGKSSILLINGSLQRRIHGLVGGFFKSPQLKAQITRDMYKYVQESTTNWSHDRPIYIQDETKKIAFQVLVKALINLDPGEEMESLRKQFQEFMAGLMSLPINIPGTRLHRSLQVVCFALMGIGSSFHAQETAVSGLNLSVCIHLLKTSGLGLRVLCDFRPSTTEVNITIKLLLVLLFSTVEFCCLSSSFGGMIDMESVEDVANISNVSGINTHSLQLYSHC
ncbi:3-epi-6-deoxocathasterone 23-monooxygenase CYP90D1-like [Humulus lupulus]|uniref:3-epi-6-deoxocathasterone 23-monooxygenase CYP90D1-like n=1 Tax=Humulus lupulus TaxID=3486 RepID=UPI002B402684|nr:3-epi-6-deoxocathasterone 23-monooxygenase CYP90D1-like [Humulus lupulus]